MNHMAGRKKHSAEDVVRKLRRADELAAVGKTNEEIAAKLEVSAATLYNWMGPESSKSCGSKTSA
jgi:putative transposase